MRCCEFCSRPRGSQSECGNLSHHRREAAPADPEFTAPASGITQQIIPTVGSNTDSQKGHTLGNVKSTKDACSAAVNQLKAARAVATGWLQCEQRRASTGISLRHSGHFFVVGSAGAGALRMRETRALMGVTTKK